MADRLSHADLDRLFDSVVTRDAATGVSEPHAVRALYRLLGIDGQPVTASRLGAALGWQEARSRHLLKRLPNVEWDEHGAVVGFGGLTLRPTPHAVVLDDQTRYAWCAWDTLFLPVALDAELTVRSACPQTSRPVRLTVTPAGVVDRDPDTTVLSFVHPEAVDADDLRGTFCGQVHFFADPAAAEPWRLSAPERLVLDLGDAFELGRHMITNRCGC